MSPQSWTMSPQEMWEVAETQDTEAIQQEAMFYGARTDSADSCPNAESQEQRGLTLYTLASRLQKQKEGLIHIWLYLIL
jgi:hypothetical protein